jgi:hypothetical protein
MHALRVLLACFALVVTAAHFACDDGRTSTTVLVERPVDAPPRAARGTGTLQRAHESVRFPEGRRTATRENVRNLLRPSAEAGGIERLFLRNCALLC